MQRLLLPVLEDRERRDRGISLERWVNAPRPPATRDDCESGPRPCPALRCEHHLGERGDGSFSCAADIADLPDAERTFDLIARAMGVSQERVVQIERAARHKANALASPEVLHALGIRRR